MTEVILWVQATPRIFSRIVWPAFKVFLHDYLIMWGIIANVILGILIASR